MLVKSGHVLNVEISVMMVKNLSVFGQNFKIYNAFLCIILSTVISSSVEAKQKAVQCKSSEQNGLVLINDNCIDPDYSQPIIDKKEKILSPVPLYKVSGHFEGTDVNFNFYFPAKDKWEGRFFQKSYPLTDGEANHQTLMFGYENGAYTVQTGGASGYRADAAVAKLSRIVASEYYNTNTQKIIYGYIYGGSGGSYQTISAMENTEKVWQGAVPYVIGTPNLNSG